MAYLGQRKSGRGSGADFSDMPTAQITEVLPEAIDGTTDILEAARVFYKRKTTGGRRIDPATLEYNATQIQALVAYIASQTTLAPTLENLSPQIIGKFIDFRRDWRYEPRKEHPKFHPKCERELAERERIGVTKKAWCTRHMTTGWVQKVKPSPNAGRAEQITISSLVHWCAENTQWHGSLKGIRRIKEQLTRKHLSPAEISKVIEASKSTANAGRDYPLTLTFFGTGLRLAEVAGMEIGDIHFGTGVIEVRAATAKLKKERAVPLFPELSEVLQQYIHTYRRKAILSDPLWITTTGKPMDREALRGVGRTLALRSKVKHFSWHLARHSYAHTSLEVGMDVLSLQSTLGHANLNETLRYSRSLSAAQLVKLPSVTGRMLGVPVGPASDAEIQLMPNGKLGKAVQASGRSDGQKGRFSLAKTAI